MTTQSRGKIANAYLLGRVGIKIQGHGYQNEYGEWPHDKIPIVTFWGNNDGLFNALLNPCLAKIKQDFPKYGVEAPIAYSTVNHGTRYIDGHAPAASKARPEDIEKQKLWARLHLMEPGEKREAKIKLGLLKPGENAVAVNQGSWTNQARKLGITKPGEKLWARTSESAG